ncbi:Recombination-promoting nuclease RpnA [Nocardia sp. RB20]|uniref:Recombination-promoting nuclease RpnA n=2 Tax=Nocardia macrotermitis TaxID=2585198 RepID=A0A7K0DF80_9NOCA|nr:Recombination-promoting nuclease RpnA [Nocardia macrotermitis]
MTAAQDNPHDSLFRAIMSNPTAAAAHLQTILPPWLVALIDWNTLELAPTRYILDGLRNRESDVVFTATMAGHHGYLHLMLEHQSTPHKHMPLRTLEYTIGQWGQHLKENPNSDHYPLVIPVVIHSGPANRTWNHSTELWDRVGTDPTLRARLGPFIPRYQIIVDDISRLSIDNLYARNLPPAVTTMLLLHRLASRNQHLDHDLKPHIEVLRAIEQTPTGPHDLHTVFTYISKVSETSPQDLSRLVDQLGPVAKEAAMTTAEQLRAEGEVKGQAVMLIHQLTIKFGPLPQQMVNRVEAADATALERWSERVLTATSLPEVFS